AARPVGRAPGPLHGGPTGPGAPRPALDAHRATAAGRRLPDLPPHAAPRARPPPGLPSPAPRRLVPHAGLLPARVEPLPPARAPGRGAGPRRARGGGRRPGPALTPLAPRRGAFPPGPVGQRGAPRVGWRL